MRIVLILVALVFIVLWLVQVKQQATSGQIRLWNAFQSVFGKVLLFVGALSLAGPCLAIVGGLFWLPNSFEWPVSGNQTALVFSTGERVVSHTALGRIQVYDGDLNFVTGWQVDGYTTDFYLLSSTKQALFYALAVKDNTIYEYDLQGKLISIAFYERPVTDGSSLPEETTFKTNPLLWPFSSPGAGLTILFVGSLLVWMAGKNKNL